jgi:hypothetical protein
MAQATSNRMSARRLIVVTLERACAAVDAVAYRPAVIKLTLGLPRWWRCELARLSVWLDDRWGTDHWTAGRPTRVCDVCKRRAAWLVVGGRDWLEDIEPDHSFMEEHPVNVCGYCQLLGGPIKNAEQLAVSMAQAREKSIAWRWS